MRPLFGSDPSRARRFKHMFEHYSRIRVEAKRAALDAIAGPVFEVGVHQNVHQIRTSDSAASRKSLN